MSPLPSLGPALSNASPFRGTLLTAGARALGSSFRQPPRPANSQPALVPRARLWGLFFVMKG